MSDNQRRFLLGKGENLAEEAMYPRRRSNKEHPYSLEVAKRRLSRQLETAVSYFDSLPEKACPRGEVTAMMVLHPAYIAKSYWPSHLIDGDRLRCVGSRPYRIVPDKVRKSIKKIPHIVNGEEEAETVALFVAGRRDAFRSLGRELSALQPQQSEAEDIIKMELLKPMTSALRLKPIPSGDSEPLLEVVLHTDLAHPYILDGFEDYLNSIGIKWRRTLYQVDGLCFCPVRAPKERVADMAEFSFVRAVRGMPKLRNLRPITTPLRSGVQSFACQVPDADVVNRDVKAAVFDGGLPIMPDLGRWAKEHEAKGVGRALSQFQEHGLAVTSALLFGPIQSGKELARPPGLVYRQF